MTCRNLPSTMPAPPPSSRERPSVVSKRFAIESCPSCDRRGKHHVLDTDDDNPRVVEVLCEACSGSGELASCMNCYGVMPAPEAEKQAFLCVGCREDFENVDAEAEMAAIRRAG